jgi:hypothetical protein
MIFYFFELKHVNLFLFLKNEFKVNQANFMNYDSSLILSEV